MNVDPRGWSARYGDRGMRLEDELGAVMLRANREVFEEAGGDVVDLCLHLRGLREAFEPPYALLLYSTSSDEALLDSALSTLTLTPEEEEAARGLSAGMDVSRGLTALMVLLDELCGLHLVILARAPEAGPEGAGPVRLSPPDDVWFPVMASTAELARVVVVLGRMGPNLLRELRYLSDAGLGERMLICTGSRVWRRVGEEVREWDLRELAEAVAEASAAEARLPDRRAIDGGY